MPEGTAILEYSTMVNVPIVQLSARDDYVRMAAGKQEYTDGRSRGFFVIYGAAAIFHQIGLNTYPLR